ncbi:hypothetical protein G5B10_13235 [Fluviicola sp. SGL-29]|nr:hypothetical protein [Fluviicola sp. SGL-29]
MKIPPQIIISTKEYVQIVTKVNLYIAKFGCKAVEMYLDTIPLRMRKRDGKNLGAYIISKVCQQYEITRYELFESSTRNITMEARQLLCVLAEKYLGLTKTEISALFNRSRHFAKRLITDFYQKKEQNHPFDKRIIDNYSKLDLLIQSYVDFKPITKQQEP